MQNANKYFLGLAWTTIWKLAVRALLSDGSQTSL